MGQWDGLGAYPRHIYVSRQWEFEKKMVDYWDILGLRMVYYWDLDFWLKSGLHAHNQ